MEVKKLYYADSHLKEFSAVVTGCEESKPCFFTNLS
mgnify:CR=1 FL=1